MDDFNFMSTGQSKPRCEHTEGYADRRNSLIPFNNSKSRQNDQILQSKGVTKIDIKVKEVILVSSALLLLAFSLVQFYKKWVKHYRDINQGSFTSYYYHYERDSLPVLNSPSLHRTESGKKNWTKLGTAITINARIRAIHARKKLEDAKTIDPLIHDNLLPTSFSSSRNNSIRKPIPRPKKWSLVKTILQPDDKLDINPKTNNQDPRSIAIEVEDISSQHGLEGFNKEQLSGKGGAGTLKQQQEGNYIGAMVYTSSQIENKLNRKGLKGETLSENKQSMDQPKLLTPLSVDIYPRRERIKSRSLDYGNEDRYLMRTSRSSMYRNEVFDDIVYHCTARRHSSRLMAKSVSMHNGDKLSSVLAKQRAIKKHWGNMKGSKEQSKESYDCRLIETGRDRSSNTIPYYRAITTTDAGGVDPSVSLIGNQAMPRRTMIL